MARKQEGRWTNVSKSVYSLVLSDDVVAAVDRAAYGLDTSRSNLINQLLADYVSFITPEKRRKDIFDSLASVLDSFEPFQVQNRGSDSMLCIRSPLRVKYNPTIRYTVELSRSSDNHLGQLKIMTRSRERSSSCWMLFSAALDRSSSGISAGCFQTSFRSIRWGRAGSSETSPF